MQLPFKLSLSLTACIYSSIATAVDVQSDASVLESLLSPPQTLRASVVQLILESDGGVIEESHILMKVKRPNGFYWETIEPFPELVVTDGKLLWNYQPDLEQVVIEAWDSERSELAAELLAGDISSLETKYSVFRRTPEGSEFTEFELRPLTHQDAYQRIDLTFDGNTLEMIYVESSSGERTVWQFKDFVVDSLMDDSEFVFVPPPDVEVIANSYVE